VKFDFLKGKSLEERKYFYQMVYRMRRNGYTYDLSKLPLENRILYLKFLESNHRGDLVHRELRDRNVRLDRKLGIFIKVKREVCSFCSGGKRFVPILSMYHLEKS